MVKAEEDPILSLSAPFPDYFSYNYNNNSSMLDMFYSNHHHQLEAEAEEAKSSFGFMELLGFQNMSPPFPCLVADPEAPNHHPTTPNSTSYYSSPAASTSARNPNNEEEDEDHPQQKQTTAMVDQEDSIEEDDEQQQKLSKQELKPKKVMMSQKKKKEREARIAFMTKSEVDHLEDGYRWRKYGQKAVKNSPFPRGYYRCTNAKCNVKKRVERCFNDPSTVVTTYEGKHTHPSPASSSPYPPNYPGFFRTAAAPTFLLPPPTAILQSQQDAFNCRYLDGTTAGAAYDEMERCSQTPNSNYAFLTDHGGFLQDIVPSPPPGNHNFNTTQL